MPKDYKKFFENESKIEWRLLFIDIKTWRIKDISLRSTVILINQKCKAIAFDMTN